MNKTARSVRARCLGVVGIASLAGAAIFGLPWQTLEGAGGAEWRSALRALGASQWSPQAAHGDAVSSVDSDRLVDERSNPADSAEVVAAMPPVESGWGILAGSFGSDQGATNSLSGRWIVLEGQVSGEAGGRVPRSFRAYALEVTDATGVPTLYSVRSPEPGLDAIPSQSQVEIASSAVQRGAIVITPSAVRIVTSGTGALERRSTGVGATSRVRSAQTESASAASTVGSNYAILMGWPINRGNWGQILLGAAEADSVIRVATANYLRESSYGQAVFTPAFYSFRGVDVQYRPEGFGDRANQPHQGAWRPSTCDWVFADPVGWLADLGLNYEIWTSVTYFQSRRPLPFAGYIYVFSNAYCGGSVSLAEVGGRRIWLMNPTRNDLQRLVTWGLGRNAGLSDSGVLNCAKPGDLSSCVRQYDANQKVVDPFDPMGVRYDDGTRPDFSAAPPDFSAASKHRLGWLRESIGTDCVATDEVCTFELPPGTKFFERTWLLMPAESPEYGTKLVRIPAPNGWYLLEYRAPIGNDRDANPRPAGVYLRREGVGGSAVLGTPLVPGALGDKSVMWNEPGSKVSIQLVAITGDRALVYARFGDKPEDACDRKRPVIEAIDTVDGKEFHRPGEPIAYRVTVRSTDPASCEAGEFALQVEPPPAIQQTQWTVTPEPIPTVTLAPNEKRSIDFVLKAPIVAVTNVYEMKLRFGPSARADLRDEKAAAVAIARAPQLDAIFNAATWIQYSNYDGKEIRAPYVAAGSLVTLAGDGLAKVGCASDSATLPPPTERCGARVIARGGFGSSEIELPLLSARPGEIKAQYPFDGVYELAVELTGTGERSNWRTPVWRDFAPGLFRAIATDPKSGIVLRHPDYARVTESKPVERGGYLIVYLTGLGPSTPPIALGQSGGPEYVIDPALVWVRIDGQNVPVAWAGKAPGMVGIDQVNIQVPYDARTGKRSFRLCAGTLCNPDIDVWVR